MVACLAIQPEQYNSPNCQRYQPAGQKIADNHGGGGPATKPAPGEVGDTSASNEDQLQHDVKKDKQPKAPCPIGHVAEPGRRRGQPEQTEDNE